VATLFLIGGLPGAGKTTLARALEQSESALRLDADEWVLALATNPADGEETARLRPIIHEQLWALAARALTLGTNVILERSFWTRQTRESYRLRAQVLGIRVELRLLEAGLEELWARLIERNANLPPGTFVVTRQELERFWSWFEPPTAAELELYSK
jgi:predicted kinase